MRKVKILYPQIRIEEKIVDVPVDIYEALKKGYPPHMDFIWGAMSEREKSATLGPGMIAEIAEMGAIRIIFEGEFVGKSSCASCGVGINPDFSYIYKNLCLSCFIDDFFATES